MEKAYKKKKEKEIGKKKILLACINKPPSRNVCISDSISDSFILSL